MIDCTVHITALTFNAENRSFFRWSRHFHCLFGSDKLKSCSLAIVWSQFILFIL